MTGPRGICIGLVQVGCQLPERGYHNFPSVSTKRNQNVSTIDNGHDG